MKTFFSRTQQFTKKNRSLIHCTALFLFMCLSARSAQVTLQWDAGAANDTYKLYCGTNSGVYYQSFLTTNTSYAVSNLSDGVTYYFSVAFWYGDGDESDKSNEAQWNSASGAPSVTLRQWARVRRH